MYEVEFYKDSQGREPVLEFIDELAKSAGVDKDSRIRYKKIREFIDPLRNFGTRIGMPVVRNIGGDLWELRPMKDRIFFCLWHENVFILLHHYKKKSQKAPAREIEAAKRCMKDFLERNM